MLEVLPQSSSGRGRAATAQVAPGTAAPATALEPWAHLERFLRRGTAAGAYHAPPRAAGPAEVALVERCLAADARRLLARLVAALTAEGAARRGPALFALALAAKRGDDRTRRAAYDAVPTACRAAPDVMQFAAHAQRFGGWGRGMRRAIGAWFEARPAAELARELAAEPAAEGFTMRDLLRLAHPRAATSAHEHLFAWLSHGGLPDSAADDPDLAPLAARAALRGAAPAAAAALVRRAGLAAGRVPDALLAAPAVWDALLDELAPAALLAGLAPMTRAGLLAPGSDAAGRVVSRLREPAELRRAGATSFALLATFAVYRAGRGDRGVGGWLPVAAIVDALEAALAACLRAEVPTGRRIAIALDVSCSMDTGAVAGVPGLTPRLASAALALAAAATEREPILLAFTAATAGAAGGVWGGGAPALSAVSIDPRQRLDDVAGALARLPMGGTDCALPIGWAQQHQVDVDAFLVYTDRETWAGDVPPARALRAYRDARGVPAKLVVVGMTSNGFAVADPDDTGMLDVVGFDASVPPVIADFVRA